MKWTTILLFIIVGLIATICLIFSSHKQESTIQATRKYYFSKHKIELTGTVNKTIIWDHDWGIVRLDVIKSNINYYDPFKDSEQYYYYYVNNDHAEVYLSAISDFQLRDSVIINSNQDSLYIYRNGTEVLSRSLYVSVSDYFYDWIRKNHVKNK